MAELVFFAGTMDSGKSTLALQMAHNRSVRGRRGLVFTRDDRAGREVLSSRLGLSRAALEIDAATDFVAEVAATAPTGVDHVICDEAQFCTVEQVEQLARVVDELGVDVFAFGILTDFRTRLFPGARRLVELADRLEVPQVSALCWCGARATHNARTVDGLVVREGAQVVLGDVGDGPGQPTGAPGGRAGRAPGVLGYEVLCRRHHTSGTTAASARD